MEQKKEINISKKERTVLDILFCLILVGILLCTQNFVNSVFWNYFGHIGLCILSFVLFIFLFKKVEKRIRIYIAIAILFLVTVFIIIMASSIIGHSFENYIVLDFIKNLTSTMTIFSIISGFVEENIFDYIYSLYENIKTFLFKRNK